MSLTWNNVDRIIKDALLNDVTDAEVLKELVDDMATEQGIAVLQARADTLGIVVVQTAMQYLAFNKARLENHRAAVVDMIREIPNEFIDTVGGGWSLINLPLRKDGVQWGEQWNADLFFGIAKGLGLAGFCIDDREMWVNLPGGLPYIYFKESV